MLSIITPAQAAKRPSGDKDYIVDFYWQGNAVLQRIKTGIEENSCGALRSLRFTWCRPKNAASSEKIPGNHELCFEHGSGLSNPAIQGGTHPFVDRMASAWLIKKFIDSYAKFQFIDERETAKVEAETVTFDIKEGEFTHIGDMCTFEVIVKSFGVKDRIVRKIAELVHELDMKDDKFHSNEAAGIEDVLTGIRKTGKGDTDILERGIAVFEMLYASKT